MDALRGRAGPGADHADPERHLHRGPGPDGVAAAPVGRGDLLGMRARESQSFALPKQMVPTDVERCTRQF